VGLLALGLKIDAVSQPSVEQLGNPATGIGRYVILSKTDG
jgi:hypothetical protein